MAALLRFDNVSKQYPNGVHALNGVSFTVGEGEFISVIGPSGSGKSTLLRAINRLISISGGTVLLEGEAVSQQRGRALRALRRKVGMIFQNYNLVYSLSVLQNVLHGRLGYMRGPKGIFGLYSEADKRQALDLLEELGLGEFSYNRASDLSGGQNVPDLLPVFRLPGGDALHGGLTVVDTLGEGHGSPHRRGLGNVRHDHLKARPVQPHCRAGGQISCAFH